MTSPDRITPERLLEHIRTRRSIRRFTDESIQQAQLERILEAARWSPSAHNRQPWRFVILTDASEKERLAEAMASRLAADLRADGVDEALIAKDTGRSRQRLTGAPVLIVVNLTMAEMDAYQDARRQDNEHVMAIQSVAMAAQNILLMAHAEGLAGVWMCAPLFCPDVVQAVLDLPANYEPQGVIALGHPYETRDKTRLPLSDVVDFR